MHAHTRHSHWAGCSSTSSPSLQSSASCGAQKRLHERKYCLHGCLCLQWRPVWLKYLLSADVKVDFILFLCGECHDSSRWWRKRCDVEKAACFLLFLVWSHRKLSGVSNSSVLRMHLKAGVWLEGCFLEGIFPRVSWAPCCGCWLCGEHVECLFFLNMYSTWKDGDEGREDEEALIKCYSVLLQDSHYLFHRSRGAATACGPPQTPCSPAPASSFQRLLPSLAKWIIGENSEP